MKLGDNERFLRGTQFTDLKDHVRFDTIFRSFYLCLTAYIHIGITVLEKIINIGQLYFEDNHI